MKPFDIKEYYRLVAEGKTPRIVTRDRKDARILCTDYKKDNYPIVAIISCYHGNDDEVFSFTSEGKFSRFGDSEQDLYFATKKREGWMLVKKSSSLFESEELAEGQCKIMGDEWAVAHIEWEE